VIESVFARKKQAYLDFCDPEKVAGFKRKAFGFLLAAVAGYLDTHVDAREIIRYLLRADAVALDERCGAANRFGSATIETLLADSGLNAFDSFKCLLHRLLVNPADGDLADFLGTTAAGYDPEFDRFV